MRKPVLLIVLLFLLLPVLSSANGQEVSLDQVVDALETPFRPETPPGRAIRDFQADFIQQAYLAALDRVEEGSGRVAVRFDRDERRNVPRFRWVYTAPTEQEIVSDGRTVWVYLPENNQVMISPLPADDQLQRDDPLAFLTGLGELSKRFRISWADPARTGQGDFRLMLEPLQPSSLVEKLVLAVDPGAVFAAPEGIGQPLYPLSSATIFGAGESRTTVIFRNIRLNQGLPDSLFTFQVPEGVDVLRPEQGSFGY